MTEKKTKKKKKAYKIIPNPVFIDGVEISEKGTEIKESDKLKNAIRSGLIEWR